eukprot:gnl/MRDRNA2_/MRDRNA2_71680_c0_seq1.p1 gnl/MRDRNA2_/MRDRNA2_71680_c0~~gnl/MRDRNA2_/MRDRNA2_71680_c0_seq1.p1  ORF type:complete len:462 (-),score=89.81 gnl/MRDRNA2_/MRDRNA2_71680_c0_seq1:12-1397(-)
MVATQASNFIRENCSESARKQVKAAESSKQQKYVDQKKAFLPWHSLHVPKETDFRGMTQQPFVDGTTLMLRNIPNKYTQMQLLEEIEDLGFADTYDFFYLPMDKQNRSNVGYAFINFIDPASATKCWSVLTNYKFQRFQSKKICAVSPAHLQGFEKNFKHFQDCAVMNARKNEKYRPVVKRSNPQYAKDEAPLEAPSPCHVLQLDKALFSSSLQTHVNADLFDAYPAERLKEDGLHQISQQPTSDFFEPCYLPVAQQLPQPQKDSAPPSSLKEALWTLLQQHELPHLQGSQTNYSSLGLPIHTDVSPKYLSSSDFEHPEQTRRQGSDELLAPPGLCQSLDPVHSSPQETMRKGSDLLLPPGLFPSLDSGHSTDDECILPKSSGKVRKPSGFCASLASEDPEYLPVPQDPYKLKKPIGLHLDTTRSGCEGWFEPDDTTPRTKHSYLADCLGSAGAGRSQLFV